MFRRKEESLFDTTTDSTYAQPASAEPAAATSTTATAPGSSATNTASSSGSIPPASSSTSRPAADLRPASNQPSNAFRPNASTIGADITRNRMPETKPATTTVSEKGNKAGRRVLTVGNDILLKGEIATCDRLVIEGKVDATLNEVHTVEISETGSFKGSAQIEDAEISGLFEGDLVVRNRLVIYATGKVRGKITYGEIEIERGGELTGEIKTVGTNSQSSSRSTRPVMKDDKVAA